MRLEKDEELTFSDLARLDLYTRDATNDKHTSRRANRASRARLVREDKQFGVPGRARKI